MYNRKPTYTFHEAMSIAFNCSESGDIATLMILAATIEEERKLYPLVELLPMRAYIREILHGKHTAT